MPDQVIRAGKLVALTYRIDDESGELLEQTELPVTYIHGGHAEIIGGMDAALEGRCAGDEVELRLAPDQGFGPRDPNLTFTDDLENVPPQFRFVGAEVQMQNERGEVRSFFVTRIADGRLTVDGNHPLAGRALRVRVRVAGVREPTLDEINADRAAQADGLPPGRLH